MRSSKTVMMLALLFLLLTPFAAVLADGHLPDLGGRTVVVAVDNAYIPFSFIDESGEAMGWDYDVLGEICARAELRHGMDRNRLGRFDCRRLARRI